MALHYWTTEEFTTNPYVIIPCSGKKRYDASRIMAGGLYTGSLHIAARSTAEAMTNRGKIRILSAKHGFMGMGDWVKPYCTTWRDVDAITPEALLKTAARVREASFPDSRIVLLLPKEYARRALAIWPDAEWPLEGCRGIGEMRHRLRLMREQAIARFEAA